MEILITAILLLFWHAMADYPLQGDFMAAAKNRNTSVGAGYWKWVLPCHAMIHAGGVLIITNSIICSTIEFVSHFVIDYLKCENRISFNQDQALHIAVKGIILAAFVAGM